MRKACSAVLVYVIGLVVASVALAQSLEEDVTPLVKSSCVLCHGDLTVTPLNLQSLGFDLADPETLRAWERVFERVESGEMPPLGAPQPDGAIVETALGSLKRSLVDASLAARAGQRTPRSGADRFRLGEAEHACRRQQPGRRRVSDRHQ